MRVAVDVDLPSGYNIIGFRKATNGDKVFHPEDGSIDVWDSVTDSTVFYFIVETTTPREIILEVAPSKSIINPGEFYVTEFNSNDIRVLARQTGTPFYKVTIKNEVI